MISEYILVIHAAFREQVSMQIWCYAGANIRWIFAEGQKCVIWVESYQHHR